jgi:hypothetical protein
MRRFVVVAVAGALAGLGLSSALAAPPAGEDKLARAEALRAAPPTDRRGPAYRAVEARAVAAERSRPIPLPEGGNFNGIRWELGGDGVGESDVDGVLGYNALCQWLRAWRDGREAALALRVLETAPKWPALRGTEAGAFVAGVVEEAGAGGGETAAAVLRDCDAIHQREVEYARALGLEPSR